MLRKRLVDVVCAEKEVKVCGVIFKIRKIDVLDYLSGAQVMKATFDTYQVGKKTSVVPNQSEINKMKKHFREVFLAAVVDPKLARKKDDEGLLVDHMFTDWDLVSGLYEKIMELSYGKKKLKRGIFRKPAWSK